MIQAQQQAKVNMLMSPELIKILIKRREQIIDQLKRQDEKLLPQIGQQNSFFADPLIQICEEEIKKLNTQLEIKSSIPDQSFKEQSIEQNKCHNLLDLNASDVIQSNNETYTGFKVIHQTRCEKIYNATTANVMKQVLIKTVALPDNFQNQFDTSLKQKNHKNIIEYYDSFIAKNNNKLFGVFVMQGAIKIEKMFQNMSSAQLRKIVTDVANALIKLHNQNPQIVYKDLNLTKIMIAPSDGSWKAVLVDNFRVDNDIFNNTVEFVAPEVWEFKQYDYRCDIFSFGKTIEALLQYFSVQDEQLLKLSQQMCERERNKRISIQPLIDLNGNLNKSTILDNMKNIELIQHQIDCRQLMIKYVREPQSYGLIEILQNQIESLTYSKIFQQQLNIRQQNCQVQMIGMSNTEQIKLQIQRKELIVEQILQQDCEKYNFFRQTGEGHSFQPDPLNQILNDEIVALKILFNQVPTLEVRMKPKKILKWFSIVLILDMSQSITSGNLDDFVILYFNEMLKQFQSMKGADGKDDEKILLTVIVFNSTVKTIVDHEFVQNVKPLDKAVYKVGGQTALNDAIGYAIQSEKIFQTLDLLPPFKSFFYIITGSQENASKTFINRLDLANMIKLHSLLDRWKFFFFGNPKSALEDGKSYGIIEDCISTLSKDVLKEFARIFYMTLFDEYDTPQERISVEIITPKDMIFFEWLRCVYTQADQYLIDELKAKFVKK